MWLPGLWQLVERRALRAQRREEHDRAFEIAERYARRRPDDPMAWKLVSWLAWKQAFEAMAAGDAGESESRTKAVGALRRGVEACPDDREIKLELGRVLWLLGRDDEDDPKRDEAIAIFTELREKYPTWPGGTLGLLDVSFCNRDWGQFDRLANELKGRISASTGEQLFTWYLSMLPFAPSRQDEAISALHDAIDFAANSHNKGIYQIVLGILLEKDDPMGAESALAAARRSLRGEFERWLEHYREIFEQWRHDTSTEADE